MNLAKPVRAMLLAVAMLSGCEKKAMEQAPPPTPPSVVVQKASPQDVVPFQIFTGSLSANQYVKILPKVSGFVQTVDFKPGATVKAGQTLFTLDSKPFKAQLDAAKADLAVKNANLQNATDERDRQERLAKEQATSEKELMNARNAYRAAAAAVESGQAAVESAKINLDYCTIASPIEGKVDVNSVEVGDLVGPATAKAMTTVAALDPIYVNYSLTEAVVVRYLQRAAQQNTTALSIPVKISIGTQDDFRYDAVLDFASNTVSQATGTIPVRATAKNSDLQLYPGLFVRVKMNEQPVNNAIVVPEMATGRDIGGDFVWVIGADNTAEKRYIKTGAVVPGGKIVESGLKPDETFVVKGLLRVRDRGKVTPTMEAPATAPAAK
jgi:RND family efflux transporter MFP subunit